MNIKRIIAVAVSAGLLAWLMADGRWRGLGEVFARLDGLTLGLAAAGFGLSYLLRALRIFDEFRTQAGGRFGSCLRITLIHNAMINVVPFRGGEAAFPLLLRQNFGVPLPRAIASTLGGIRTNELSLQLTELTIGQGKDPLRRTDKRRQIDTLIRKR